MMGYMRLYKDGFQACYDVMREVNCDNFRHDTAADEWYCKNNRAQGFACATKWQDCPLHKEKP
jgi:hypothetical protein